MWPVSAGEYRDTIKMDQFINAFLLGDCREINRHVLARFRSRYRTRRLKTRVNGHLPQVAGSAI
jgi:hypothetical protein